MEQPSNKSGLRTRLGAILIRHKKLSLVVLHLVAATLAAVIVLFLAGVCVASVMRGLMKPGLGWMGHAVFGSGILLLTIIVHHHERLRHRLTTAGQDGHPTVLPDHAELAYNRFRLPCMCMGSAAGFWICFALWVHIIIYDTIEKDFRAYLCYIILPLFGAFTMLIFWRLASRLMENPARALRAGITLDRKGLTMEGWDPIFIPWNAISDVEYQDLSSWHRPEQNMILVLQPLFVDALGNKPNIFKNRLVLNLRSCRDRPDQVYRNVRAFLERARREQGFLPARPLHPSPSPSQ